MKITVKYEVSGHIPADWRAFLVQRTIRDSLRTGLDAANAQLEAENKKLRLKLVDIEVE